MSKKRIQRAVESAIPPNEQVLCRIEAINGDTLICTNDRVVLIRSHGWFGTNSFEVACANITTFDIKMGFIVGELHIGTSSMMATKGITATTGLAANVFIFQKKLEPDVRRFVSIAFDLRMKGKSQSQLDRVH